MWKLTALRRVSLSTESNKTIFSTRRKACSSLFTLSCIATRNFSCLLKHYKSHKTMVLETVLCSILSQVNSIAKRLLVLELEKKTIFLLPLYTLYILKVFLSLLATIISSKSRYILHKSSIKRLSKHFCP